MSTNNKVKEQKVDKKSEKADECPMYGGSYDNCDIENDGPCCEFVPECKFFV